MVIPDKSVSVEFSNHLKQDPAAFYLNIYLKGIASQNFQLNVQKIS